MWCIWRLCSRRWRVRDNGTSANDAPDQIGFSVLTNVPCTAQPNLALLTAPQWATTGILRTAWVKDHQTRQQEAADMAAGLCSCTLPAKARARSA